VKLTIVCMGRTREHFIHEGIGKYMRYLKHYVDVEIKELKEEKIHDLKDAPLIRKKEAERIFKTISKNVFIAAMDERGQAFTSHEFATVINRMQESGVKEIAFVIGGAMGLDESILAKANKNIALSSWTMTHEMARLVLLEQLYRAFTIITGKTYHY
jgi:23S rRNA (pseudouridine1915-N3)-methyltransferase